MKKIVECVPNFSEGRDKTVIEAIAQAISGKPQKVEIRGHTSTRPLSPNSPYQTHWDLGYARCSKTMQCLTRLGIDPKRFRISVAAKNEPIDLGLDPEMRKKNARVEVLMLDELTEDLKATKEEEERQETATLDTP